MPRTQTLRASIVVDEPVSMVYNQWTQFETFPRFMQHVQEVRQLDAKHLHWRAKIAGKTKEWETEITEQVPDERITWKSTSGTVVAGTVAFRALSDGRTQVDLQVSYRPETLMERAGAAVGAVRFNVNGDLRRFKEFLEARKAETGAWRGRISKTTRSTRTPARAKPGGVTRRVKTVRGAASKRMASQRSARISGVRRAPTSPSMRNAR